MNFLLILHYDLIKNIEIMKASKYAPLSPKIIYSYNYNNQKN